MAGNVYELTMSCASERHLGLPTSSAYLADAEKANVSVIKWFETDGSLTLKSYRSSGFS